MSTFTGFSEEDLQRMKTSETGHKISINNLENIRRIDKIGFKPKKLAPKISLPLDSDEAPDTTFDKCKLSIKSTNMEAVENSERTDNECTKEDTILVGEDVEESRRSSIVTPDVIRCVDNYAEDEQEVHKAKLEDLQLKQKLMEEQNKKRKEMLAKVIADRTKQTEEEVMKLEKIKKELEVLDGQLSKDVATLRKKIDQACINYSEAEKLYLKVEKEFLQSKISLQREKEKKELLIEHLCTLITHNETRKAEKLETLMLELAAGKTDVFDGNTSDESPVIVDGVDEKTGKMMDYSPDS